MYQLLYSSTLETLWMVSVSGIIALLLGVPLGLFLFATRRGSFHSLPWLNQILGLIVNGLRSFPFFILMIALIPLTRWLVGTSIGTAAATVPLAIAGVPFLARLVENVLTELPVGLIETGQSMGASNFQIAARILLPEAIPGIINAWMVTLIGLVGYSAMAGAVGGGGLGNLAFIKGYQAFDTDLMLATIVILVIMVQLLQWLGDGVVYFLQRRKR